MMEAIHNLHGEGLIQLPDVDIFHLQSCTAKQLGHGEDWADSHLIGVTAGYLEAAKNKLIRNTELISSLARHKQRGRSAIRKLRRIARRYGAFAARRIKMRLERQQTFKRCIR